MMTVFPSFNEILHAGYIVGMLFGLAMTLVCLGIILVCQWKDPIE